MQNPTVQVRQIINNTKSDRVHQVFNIILYILITKSNKSGDLHVALQLFQASCPQGHFSKKRFLDNAHGEGVYQISDFLRFSFCQESGKDIRKNKYTSKFGNPLNRQLTSVGFDKGRI